MKFIMFLVGGLLMPMQLAANSPIGKNRVEDFEGFPHVHELSHRDDDGYASLRTVALAGGAVVLCVLLYYKYSALKKRLIALFEERKKESKPKKTELPVPAAATCEGSCA